MIGWFFLASAIAAGVFTGVFVAGFILVLMAI